MLLSASGCTCNPALSAESQMDFLSYPSETYMPPSNSGKRRLGDQEYAVVKTRWAIIEVEVRLKTSWGVVGTVIVCCSSRPSSQKRNKLAVGTYAPILVLFSLITSNQLLYTIYCSMNKRFQDKCTNVCNIKNNGSPNCPSLTHSSKHRLK
jgi:hypothetical protein